MKKVIKFEGIDCANCAARLERALAKIRGIEEVSVNFMAQKMVVIADDDKMQKVLSDIVEVTEIVMPECVLKV